MRDLARHGSEPAGRSGLVGSAGARYLAECRTVAAEKASLSLAGVLGDLVELTNDKAIDGASRVAAFRLALEHLAPAAPAPALGRRQIEAARESAFANRALVVVDALLGSELSVAELLGAIKAGTEMAHTNTQADDIRNEHRAAAPAEPPADQSVVQPKWLQPVPPPQLQ